MRNISFLPPQSTQKTEKDRKLVQSRIRAHTAQHRLQQDAKKKQKAAEEYWRRLEKDNSIKTENRSDRSLTISPSPVTILKKGNSDPFGAYAVPISPRLNQIILFYTSNFLPTYYDIATIASPSSQAILKYRYREANDDYTNAVGVLQQQSAAHGFFLAYGSIMADLSNDSNLRLEMMRLKSLAVTALSNQIRNNSEDDPRTIDAVLMLFQAAVFAGSVAEATIHGRSLRRLLDQKAAREGPQSINVGHLFQALWLNVAFSATFLTPTFMDVDRWAPSIFSAILGECQNISLLTPSAGPAFPCLEPSIVCSLRSIFLNCRRFLWLYWTCPSQATTPDATSNLFTYLYSEFFVHSGRLINHLVSIRSRQLIVGVNPDPKRLHEHVLRWHTELILASALLVLMSASTATILHAGRALVMATNLLLIRLKAVLEPVLCTCLSPAMSTRAIVSDSKDPRDDLSRAALWALFVGAAIDHIPKSKQVHGTEASSWFTHNFVELVKNKSLQTAEKVKVVLRRFVYTDDMLPDELFWNDLCGEHTKSVVRIGQRLEPLANSAWTTGTVYCPAGSEGNEKVRDASIG